MASDIGTTARLIFGTTGWAPEVVSITIGGITRPAIDFTHLLTPIPAAGEMGGRVFKPGKLADPGEIGMELHWDADTVPPIMQPAEDLTLEFPLADGGNTPAKYTFQGFLTAVSGVVPLEEKMAGNGTVKVSGVMVHVPAT